MTQKNTMRRRFVVAATAAAVAVTGLAGAAKAEFPEKEIQFIIPFGAGGGADIEGRLLAKEMGKVLGVPVVAVNKPGGGGAVTYTFTKNAKPDGYTMAWASTSILTTTNIGNVPYKHDALDHLGQVEYQPMPLAVRADAPWKTFKEFAEHCAKNPGTLKMANSSAGSATHVAAIAYENAVKGCKFIHLPVGVKRRNATVLSGEADGMVGPLTALLNLTKAGKIRLLAIASDKRNTVIPEVPTAAEQGYPAKLNLFRSISVPKGTPAAVKAKLADAMIKAAKSDAFMGLAKKKGFTVEPLTGGEFDTMINTEDGVVRGIMVSAGLYQSKKK